MSTESEPHPVLGSVVIKEELTDINKTTTENAARIAGNA